MLRTRTHGQPSRPFAAMVPSRLVPAAAAALLLALAGCTVGPNYQRSNVPAPPSYKELGAPSVVAPPNPAGGSWKPATPSDGMLRGKWWEIFQDPQLNALEEQLTTSNQSLRAAAETYLAAREQVAVARSQFYPSLSVGISGEHEKQSAHRPFAQSTSRTSANDLLLAGQASWEPDFWGRIRRSVEAAHANAQASAADLASLDLSLHAELAMDYFELRGLDSDSRLLQSTVHDYQHQLDLNQNLVKGGLATEVVVAQAETQLETVRAELIDVEQARKQYEHAIATLINKEAADVTLQPAPLDMPLPQIPVGVPSQLIERRPDVAASERRVATANAQIGVAVSAYYPSISLGGEGGFESTHGGTWIQGPSSLWSLGAQAVELLFDAGRRHALTEQSRHLYEAQVSTYKATVLASFNEVEDRLSDLRVLSQESVAERRAVDAAQRSLDLSNRRYKGGATSYLEVLTAESALLSNQRTATDLETRQFAATVGLIRSLGGGWDTTQLPQ